MTVRRKKIALAVTLACGVPALLLMSQSATANHPRPKSAQDGAAALVPAYQQCTSANRTHGAPLAFPSCNPPVPASTYLTSGTPDANGAPTNQTGVISLAVATLPPPQADVNISGTIADVRCTPAGPPAFCTDRNAPGGPDYTGTVSGQALLRITDHNNGPFGNPSGGTDPATLVDIPLPVPMQCARTWKINIGSSCAVTTSTNAIVPGAVQATKRTIVELSQFQAYDGGADGNSQTTSDNTLYLVQGLFAP
jgi:hypothetical protein